jgi:uncharacterized protein YqjF (DUF2071 family)
MTMAVMPVQGRHDEVRALGRWRPWFIADWRDALFVHYGIEPSVLQPHVPFELELFEGRAWVSLVAFTQRGLRPAIGGRWTSWAMAPVATHAFLNLRTYVRGADGVTGICFLAEWIPNRLSRIVGPLMYGLPFRLGRLRYEANERAVRVGGLGWRAEIVESEDEAVVAGAGTLDEFLLERYTAFTARRGRGYCFHIRHEPWRWRRVDVRVNDDSLLCEAAPWFPGAELCGAHRSEGLHGVRMSGPRRVSARPSVLSCDQLFAISTEPSWRVAFVACPIDWRRSPACQ